MRAESDIRAILLTMKVWSANTPDYGIGGYDNRSDLRELRAQIEDLEGVLYGISASRTDVLDWLAGRHSPLNDYE